MLNTAAKSFLNAVGASSGPLYATALMRAAAAVKGKAELDDADVVAMVEAMAKGIQDRGKADVGEKTMVDAWAPAAAAVARRRRRRQQPRRQPGGGRRRGTAGRGGDQGHAGDQGAFVASRRAGAAATSTRALPRPWWSWKRWRAACRIEPR